MNLINYSFKRFKNNSFIRLIRSWYSYTIDWLYLNLLCSLIREIIIGFNHWDHRVIKSKYLASLWRGWAKPANGMFQVPSQATFFFSGLKMTWWAVKVALSGVHLKNPGCEIFHNLASLNLLLLLGMTWMWESLRAL